MAPPLLWPVIVMPALEAAFIDWSALLTSGHSVFMAL